jgi:hypothetical protein
MVSLVDIVPQTKMVQIDAGKLELRGLGLRQIADLFLTFPSLRNIFTEGAPEIDAAEIILMAPDAIGTIIALSAGQPEAAIKIVDVGTGLAPDELLLCLEAIIQLTFPRGVTPFLEKMLPLLALIGGGARSGRALDTSLPPQPSNSSLQGTPSVQ